MGRVTPTGVGGVAGRIRPVVERTVRPTRGHRMSDAFARVETLRETQTVYQVWCEEHKTIARFHDSTEAVDLRIAHNESCHRWAEGLSTEDTDV